MRENEEKERENKKENKKNEEKRREKKEKRRKTNEKKGNSPDPIYTIPVKNLLNVKEQVEKRQEEVSREIRSTERSEF